jgi:hypothetical protein
MSNDIKVTMTSDQRQLIADLIKQQQELTKVSGKFVELGTNAEKAMRKAQGEITTTKVSFTNILPSITNMAAGYLSASAAISTFITAQKQAQEEATATGRKFDEIFRKMQVQGGMTDLQRVENQGRVLAAAEKVGVDSTFAANVATQMISSGFSTQDATGAGLQTMLQGFAASNLLGQDPTQLTQAVGQFLAAQGMDKNSQNLKRVMVGSQRLFKATDMQVSDLSQLAGKSQGLAGAFTPEETLATFDVLREKTGADVASTSLKIFTDRLRGASQDKQRTDTLKKLGLTAADVDFQGENIETVLERLATGFGSVKATDREGLMQKLFGTEASSPIAGLIRDRGKVGAALGVIGDNAGFNEDVKIATSGRNAEERRQEVRRERLALMEDEGADIARKELDNQLRMQGFSPAGRAFVTTGFDTARTFGASVEDALTFSQPGQGVITGRIPGMREGGEAAVREAVLATLKAINPEEYQRRVEEFNRKQLEVMRSIDANIKRQPIAPPPKPPSAALGAKR